MRTTLLVTTLFASFLASFVSAAPLPGTADSSNEIASLETAPSPSSLVEPASAPANSVEHEHHHHHHHHHPKKEGGEEVEVHLHRRVGGSSGEIPQARQEYYTPKQQTKHAEAASLVEKGNEHGRLAEIGLRKHGEALQNAQNSLHASATAHANGNHDEAKQHKTDHDNHLKTAKTLADNVAKDAQKQQQNYAAADKIIAKHTLEKNHPDFRHN
ncbi:hypothetical protein FRC17_004376 [Serendipita sp. 399]|nr:hypothetical protein FRC17_004376 [Serendipita sp. 399]